jgi:hypothetical protein
VQVEIFAASGILLEKGNAIATDVPGNTGRLAITL